MTTTTALLLDKSDYTKDGNLKQEAFMAICAHDVVLSGSTVVKCQRPVPEPEVVQTPILFTQAPSASSTSPKTETPPPSQAELA